MREGEPEVAHGDVRGLFRETHSFLRDPIVYFQRVRARYGETLNLSLSYSRNDIDLPNGSVITNLTSVRFAYNFSPRLFVQTLLQHNDSADLWSTNFRVGWLQDANTGLFIVYNETEGIGNVVPSGAGRSVILKFSYLFNVLD